MTETNPRNDSDTVAPEFDQEVDSGIREPPRRFSQTLLYLGPGLVIAGSIVGSGELIATTKTGAQAGISLLWLIIFGCLIKVFVQIELGRHSIIHGQTTLDTLNRIPGRIGPANGILWFWLAMMLAGLFQLGGIVGGVGQALAITFPITGDYRDAVQIPSDREIRLFIKWHDDLTGSREQFNALEESRQQRVLQGYQRLEDEFELLGERGQKAIDLVRSGGTSVDPKTWDDRWWALAIAVFTAAVLFNGRYNTIQNFSTVLVVSFTVITVGNAIALQTTDQWSLSLQDFVRGLSFQLPEGENKVAAIKTALATFGIIGVGAAELITYPYWCIEKGYARYCGKRTDDEAWAERARGWMRVMRCDAFLSMVLYTVATVAFYLMGVAVLYREGRDPEAMRMITTLAAAYIPVFGESAKWLFLGGAIAVLYSTFLVANAGHARLLTDATKIFGIVRSNDQAVHNRVLSLFCFFLPLICVAFFWTGINPVTAVLISGVMQAAMLPLLAFGALYFRYTASDERLRPSLLGDIALIISSLALLIGGTWGVVSYISEVFIEKQ